MRLRESDTKELSPPSRSKKSYQRYINDSIVKIHSDEGRILTTFNYVCVLRMLAESPRDGRGGAALDAYEYEGCTGQFKP
jgi:hypothetical protein